MAKSSVVVDGAAVASHDFSKSNGLARSVHEEHSEGPSMTRQEFADECDINNIMLRYESYLADPMRTVRAPVFYDFTSMPDSLMGAMEVFRRGEEAFFTLPASVRREFDNNPAMFVDFASDPANLPQMKTWGLTAAEAVPDAPMKVEVVSTVAPPKDAPVVPPGG